MGQHVQWREVQYAILIILVGIPFRHTPVSITDSGRPCKVPFITAQCSGNCMEMLVSCKFCEGSVVVNFCAGDHPGAKRSLTGGIVVPVFAVQAAQAAGIFHRHRPAGAM